MVCRPGSQGGTAGDTYTTSKFRAAACAASASFASASAFSAAEPPPSSPEVPKVKPQAEVGKARYDGLTALMAVVIAYVRKTLDAVTPLANASWTDVTNLAIVGDTLEVKCESSKTTLK